MVFVYFYWILESNIDTNIGDDENASGDGGEEGDEGDIK